MASNWYGALKADLEDGTIIEPSLEDIMDIDMFGLGGIPAACEYGCEVEPDGHCEHGKPSWMIVWGVI